MSQQLQLHLNNTHHPHRRPDRVNKPLTVITSVFNPLGFASRYHHYFNWEKHILDAGCSLITVEAAVHDRDFVIKDPYNERHKIVHVRTDSHIWLKENLNNIGARHVDPDCKYLAFMDADMHNMNPNWIDDTIQALQYHSVVQMFSELMYLGPVGQHSHSRFSFAERWLRGMKFCSNGKTAQNKIFAPTRMALCQKGIPYPEQQAEKNGDWGPPGGAWAYRREEFERVGGLIDFCILGAADWYMAAGICGFMDVAVHRHTPQYVDLLTTWEQKAVRAFRKNLGVLNNTMVHYWHGKGADRRYGAREEILQGCRFNPLTDIVRDMNGVIGLHDDGSERMRSLRDQCYQYFSARNEDSIDQ